MSSEAQKMFSSARKLNHKRWASNGIRVATLAVGVASVVAGPAMQKDKSDNDDLAKKTSDKPVVERQKPGHSNAMRRN
jgi:NAD(P)-dependent dehydrogenase (short-subunit alcohol dehydrogenase family)